ncbi:dipeptide/oligopeptide/nickel ABC transporter permease/ATP-binding protein [Arthrobacter sp. SD76]|uniref:dipeptide/oligopeptide/nickel ABC transporter permease/ATP-binding protein n=1 Tax=Arthrobacter sp. SD76 TaxID=3415007 RepID=UPI003C74A0C2
MPENNNHTSTPENRELEIEIDGSVAVAAPAAAPARRRPRGLRIARTPRLIVAVVLLAFFALMAIFGPLLAPYDPSSTSLDFSQGPSAAHWLGTTQSGQDILSQLLVGAQLSMLVAVVAGAIAVTISIIVGVTAGYLGGWWGEILGFVTNVFIVIPAFPLMILAASVLRGVGWLGTVLVIGLTGWAFGARLLRAQTLSLRNRDFVRAAVARGESTFRIIFCEIVPNLGAILLTVSLFLVLFGLLAAAGLDFLGIGDPNSWSWGKILYWAQSASAFATGAWWWYVPPGLCLALLGMCFALINLSLDEAINPRLRSTRRRKHREAATIAPAPAALHADEGDDALLKIRNLTVTYGEGESAHDAVKHVDLTLHRGEILGLVGESGSGKSTLSHAVTRLLRPPGRVTTGSVVYKSSRSDAAVDILTLDIESLRALRWSEISIVFQSSMNAMNPVVTIESQLTDVLETHRPEMTAAQRHQRAIELLELVRIPTDRLSSYQHELSGGMRQRVMLAMALALEPQIVILDEPTTALDVVVQREVLDEVLRLRTELGFAVIFVTHDLALVLEISDTVAVMKSGDIVEIATAEQIHREPKQEYTRRLLTAFPTLHSEARGAGITDDADFSKAEVSR